jgi:hypothetical protein
LPGSNAVSQWFTRLPLIALISLAAWLSSCGYVGEPLPPALHIPQRVTDLSATERGDQIVAQFTLPAHTTENLAIQKSVKAELAVGTAGSPFHVADWEGTARVFHPPTGQAAVEYAVPAAEWIGKDVVIGVKVSGSNGRTAGWSNLFTLSVVQPLEPPAHLEAKNVPEGVELAWQGSAPGYRIYRRAGEETKTSAIGESGAPTYSDTKTEYGTAYRYSVEGFRTGGDVHAVSLRSAEVAVTPRDIFPPPVPTGLAAVVSTGSIELMWDRNTAPDLAGYRVYRAQQAGAFEKLAEVREAPTYSDRQVTSGQTYRYAVTAFDKAGNESAKSAPVTAAAP